MILPVLAVVVAVARGMRPGSDGGERPYHRWTTMAFWQEGGDPTSVVVSVVIPTLDNGDVRVRSGFMLPSLDLEKTDPAEYARQYQIAAYANDALVIELDSKIGCGGGGRGLDFNGDGVVNSSDFFEFLQAYLAG